MTQALHLTLAQINPIVGDLTYNLNKIRHVRDNAPENTDLIIYPETITTGYPPDDLVLKPFFMFKVEELIQTLVEESKTHPAHLLVSTPLREDGKLYNASLLIGGGEIKTTIYKNNLPNYGVFDEARVFTSGPLPEPCEFKGYKLGFLICEDMWTPAAAKNLKDKGAEILISPNGSPYEIGKHDLRLQVARNRVEETGLPLIYVNQLSGQDELIFDGGSFVMMENGQVTLQAKDFEEDIHHITLEKKEGGPWLCTADTLHKIRTGVESIYQALVLGLRDYVTKNGFPGVVIGMSGGIDSALSAAIAVDALGAENVHTIMMPSPFTSQESLDDAAQCARLLGLTLDEISIEAPMKAFEETLVDLKGTAHENMQSRCRGLILMAYSNTHGHMVLSSGNKSEMAVGYSTLYGDMCGGFNALKDIYKTQVYELARWRNSQSPAIPENIITKKPTAELRPNQTDQDSLPEYEELDDILTCLIEHDLSLTEILERGHDEDTVRKVWKLLDRAEYKRRQAPPGVKITPRAFGRDRRYPITNHFLNIF